MRGVSRAGPGRAADYRRLAAACAADPHAYAAAVLGVALTPQQRAIPGLLGRPPYRLLMPAANGVGKTFALGWLVNHFHDAHDPGVILATSATYRQVRDQLFKEVRRLRPLGLGLKPRAPELFHHERHFALGFSTNKADAFQGHHEGALLIVMDEATGVPAEFADRAETMFKGVPGHGWVAAYNPNDPTTWPYAAEQSGGWHVHRLSALDHPNVAAELRGEPPPYPGAVRLHRVRERIARECEDWGRGAVEGAFEFPPGSGRYYKPVRPEFNPQVRGLWPAQSADAVWSEADWRRCCASPDHVDPRWPVQVGCDVARFGTNRTAIAVRRGTALVWLEAHQGWDSRRTGDRLRELCEHYCPEGDDPRSVPVAVDDSGGYGSGVTDHPDGYAFVGVVAAAGATDPGRYPNRRSELWFAAKLAAEQGGLLVGPCPRPDLVEQLRQELLAARYSLDAKGRRVVEGKKAVSERLRRSPDLADAVNLAWYPL